MKNEEQNNTKQKVIKVTSQKEWDGLPSEFEEFTCIHILSGERIIIRSNPKDSRTELRGSSSAELCDNSSAVLRENSSAELCDNSRAVLYDNSSAELCDNSSAVLRENSSAELWGNSRAELYDNSSAELWENSRAELWGSSSAVLWGRSFCHCFSSASKVRLEDYSCAHIVDCSPMIEKTETTTVINSPRQIKRDFEYMLSRGYVEADGIIKKLKSQKKLGEVTLYTVEEFLDQSESYIAKKGAKFAHGKTVKEAVEDLRYKFSDRDTSKFENWQLGDEKTLDEFLEAYHAITGACSLGMKEFVDTKNPPEKCTVKQAIELTKGAYQSDVFRKFFECRGG